MKQLKNTLLCVHCLLGVFTQAQESRDIKYPKGMYMSFESYQNRKPTDTITAFHAETSQDSIKYRFYNTATAERLKKVFAFSDGEHVFVNNKLLLKHMNRTDFGKQLRDDGRFYLKAKKKDCIIIITRIITRVRGLPFGEVL